MSQALQQKIKLPGLAAHKATKKQAKNLTPAQYSAVTHAHGPLLIIAGAGSGKTNVITRRLAWLLTEGPDTSGPGKKPLSGDQILAVTFSNKATEEMEERLDRLMPVGYEEPWINTFHAFGERVLRQNALALGLDPGFTVLTPAQQHVLVRRNLDQFELDYYRPSGNPTKFISALIQLFSRAKDEAVGPDEYLAWAKKNAEPASVVAPSGGTLGPASTGSAASGPDDTDVTQAAAQEEAARLLEVAKAYATYEKLLLEEGVLDVSDLITKTLELLRKRPSVLVRYQKQFKAILVDEFQDTNTAQYELIKLLAGTAMAADPQNKGKTTDRSLVVVADDDQAIYRWRGASVANVLQFMRDYPHAKQVALLDNFRSVQPVLDAAYTVVQHNNPERLEAQLKISKRLVAARGSGSPPVHYQSATREHEVAHTVGLLIDRHERGTPWSQMAILVRSNAAAEPIVAGLAQAGVPFAFMASKGLFARPEILDLLAWLRLVADYHDSVSLYRLLSGEHWRIPPLELVQLVHSAKKKSRSLFEAIRALSTGEDESPSRAGTPSSSGPDNTGLDVSEETQVTLANLLTLHEQHTELSTDKSAGAMLIAYLEATKLLDRLEKKQTPDATDQILNINRFLKLILDFEREAADKSCRGFLEYYDLLLAAGESPSPADVDASPDQVRILTVHASKGLEFGVVVIFHAVEQHFPSRNRRDPIELPVELVERHEQLGALDDKQAHIAEERRLFYVACTRARDELIVTSSLDDGGVRKRKPSRFIEEAKITTIATPDTSLLAASRDTRKTAQWTTDKGLAGSAKIKLPLPKRFSYTQLMAFETCPQQYKYAHIYKIPSLGSHVFSYGKSLHETLAQFYRELAQAEHTAVADGGAGAKGERPNKARLLELLDHYWINEWFTSKAHEQKRKAEARQALERWYDAEGKQATPAYWVEQDFSLKIGAYHLHGRIDRADRLPDGSLEIIDYKTGKLKDPKEQQKNNQLALYALAAQKTFKQTVSKLSWYFLDSGTKVTTTRSPEQLKDYEREVLANIESILASDFLPTPGFHCKFCDFKNICEAGQASHY